MRFVSFETNGRTGVGLLAAGGIVDVGARLGHGDTLRSLLARNALDDARRFAEHAADYGLADVRLLPTVPDPGKIVCIGINYRNRDGEYGTSETAAPPAYPSVFFRTPESLVAHGEPILRPPESVQLDYEGEIVLVIGRAGRRIAEADAWSHVAGVSLMNEGSVRDWLRHAKFNVTPGKNFARSGSLGPWMVTADEIAAPDRLHLTTRVNGEVRQDDWTSNLMFPFERLIAYTSTFMPLQPGDLIATGTPTGAGARFDPPKFLRAGDVVEVEVPEIGTLRNPIVDERL